MLEMMFSSLGDLCLSPLFLSSLLLLLVLQGKCLLRREENYNFIMPLDRATWKLLTISAITEIMETDDKEQKSPNMCREMPDRG